MELNQQITDYEAQEEKLKNEFSALHILFLSLCLCPLGSKKPICHALLIGAHTFNNHWV